MSKNRPRSGELRRRSAPPQSQKNSRATPSQTSKVAAPRSCCAVRCSSCPIDKGKVWTTLSPIKSSGSNKRPGCEKRFGNPPSTNKSAPISNRPAEAAEARLRLKKSGYALKGGSPIKQPLGTIGDVSPRIARRGDSVKVDRRYDERYIIAASPTYSVWDCELFVKWKSSPDAKLFPV